MAHYNQCPLCNSGNLILHARCIDHFLTNEEFRLVRCSHCGFIFTQDHPDEENAGKYYDSVDYVSYSDGKGLLNRLYSIARVFMIRNKRNLIRRLTGLKTGKLLDIGSGGGHFLYEMKNAGWDTTGIEINDKARDLSQTKFGLNVLEPEKIRCLEPESFDCITLWHVLEHFHDPYLYACEIKRLLKSGGTCIAAIPNCISYDAIHYGPFWAAYDVPRHLWHFTPDTFKRFSEKAGFKLTGIVPLPLDVFYISILSEKYKGSKIYFVSGILKGAWFSFLSIFRKNKSSSLIYVLKNQV